MLNRNTPANAPDELAHRSHTSYELVRQERLVVGPTTSPYPINHETVLQTSDSQAELARLRDELTGAAGATTARALQPDTWIDAMPGQKAVHYDIRRA